MVAGTEALEQQLWAEHCRGVADARARLIEKYLPLAKRIASALFAGRAVDDVEFGDFLQFAYVGLLEAVDRYRAEDGVQFATFATYRIRGAILNNIAKMTETGERLAYLRRARRERVKSLLEQEAGDDEGLSAMVQVLVEMAVTIQLDEIAETEGAEPSPAIDPYASRSYDDIQRRVREVLALLPEKDRQIIDFHYFQQIGFEEIANILLVSKGRVSQLHKRAVSSIREMLRQRRINQLR